ncbi:hypothetical protein [Chroococcidiopsis sp. SAG 2025]|uniref:hypothetical protein n=1 Tax=Chroococcidiopsis sp. SAG 2025 TaxID=171389 RepID=UPI00293727B2|nr:hypothetical protein [Chroococcidiopsis sp. SAG 2025]
MKKIGYVILTIVTAIFLIIGSARKAPAQQAPTSSIQGFTWSDLNNDGIQSANEPPSINASIFLDLNNNGVADVGDTKRHGWFVPLRSIWRATAVPDNFNALVTARNAGTRL